jgi:hypothetical protein
MNIATNIKEFTTLSSLEERAFLGGWGERDILAMVYGFFDESGEHGFDGKLLQLTLGGFIARWPEVEALCREWRTALDHCCWSEFHMREFASDEDKFDTWPPERRARLDGFVDILCSHVSHFCAFSYPVTAATDVFKDTYETALSRVMLNAEWAVKRHGDRIRLTFAQSQEIRGDLIGGYFRQSNWDEARLEEYSIARSSGSPPLQAAEIVVRGFAREVRDGIVSYSLGRIRAKAKMFDSRVHRLGKSSGPI